jgi:SAM-dependent methyltransferase
VDRSADIQAAVIEPNRQWFRSRRVVDLGCGTGSVTEVMSMAGGRVTGVETCPALACIASARLGASQVWVGDWAAYVPAVSVDLVTFWSSTFGIESSDQALGRVRDWLAPGGRVLVDVVDADRLLARFRESTELQLADVTLVERRELDKSGRRVIVSWELDTGLPLGGYEFMLFDAESLLGELSAVGFADACLLEAYDEDRLVATGSYRPPRRPIASR